MSYRYIGNKTRLLDWLIPIIQDISPRGATVADLMCGTAAVSEALRLRGYRVIASDVMTFAAHHAKVRLTMPVAPTFDGLGRRPYLDVLWELQNIAPLNAYMVREYSPAGEPDDGSPPRQYFTEENAAKLDAIRYRMQEWHCQGCLTQDELILLRHDLVLAANRVANVAGTYGHFRSKWSNGSLAPLRLAPTRFIPQYRTDHTVLQGYAEDLAPSISADVCYLDPPYMKRQYAANYHLLETIARGDEPPAVGKSGLRPWRDQYSDFCSKVRIRDAFAKVITPMDCPHFLVSYSEDGLLSRDEIESLLSTFGDVSVTERAFPRFRSNQSELGTHVMEYVFHVARR